MTNLALSEQETMLNMTADDRTFWTVYSDDVVMQNRLEKIDAEFLRNGTNGIGKYYKLRADQLVFRKGKRQLSPERKAQLAERMRSLRNATVTTVAK